MLSELGRESAAYINFLRGKEKSGLERALLARVLSKGDFEMGDYRRYSIIVGEQASYFEVFRSLADPEQASFFEQLMTDSVVDEVQRIRQLAFKSGEVSTRDLGVNSKHWIDAITKKINLMQEVEERLAEDIIHLIQTIDPKSTELHRRALRLGRLVHEIQKERGYTAGYLGSRGKF